MIAEYTQLSSANNDVTLMIFMAGLIPPTVESNDNNKRVQQLCRIPWQLQHIKSKTAIFRILTSTFIYPFVPENKPSSITANELHWGKKTGAIATFEYQTRACINVLTASAHCDASTRLYWPRAPRSWWHASTARAEHQKAEAVAGAGQKTSPSKKLSGASEHFALLPLHDALEAVQ